MHRPAATLTLALPLNEAPQPYLADISVPRLAYRRVFLTVPNLFADATIIRLSSRSEP